MLGKFTRTASRESAAPKMTQWLALVATLPIDEPTGRMKVLRTLETLGCAILRDGVFLLPETPANRSGFERLALSIRSINGASHLLSFASADAAQDAEFRALFDRSKQYQEIAKILEGVAAGFGISDAAAIGRVVSKQRDDLNAIHAIDFFGSPTLERARTLLAQTERKVSTLLFPSEPTSAPRESKRSAFFRKTWVTRRPLLADRLASAWLIRRFIDAEATLSFVDKSDAPAPSAVTFGFAGAQFGNTQTHVTFEELVAFFKLNRDAALVRIGTLVKGLESGDRVVPESASVDTMIEGARRRATSDEQLFAECEKILDMLYDNYFTPAAAAGRSVVRARLR
jgi:hypothetical protein